MFIQNVSYADIQRGHHYDAGENSMLIQINDPEWGSDVPQIKFPLPKMGFKEIHRFRFLDADDRDEPEGPWNPEWLISDEDANELVQLLQKALDNRMNVIVHCHAGICRSGAVTEVGVIMGFDDTDTFRQPNLMVKRKMMQVLGLTYDSVVPAE